MSDYFSGGAIADATLTFYKVKEEIERLRAENEQLKNHIIDVKQHHCKLHDAISERAEKAKQENNQLKQVLRKCSPFRLMPHPEAKCIFCGKDDEQHADDCEYVRLTGGAE